MPDKPDRASVMDQIWVNKLEESRHGFFGKFTRGSEETAFRKLVRKHTKKLFVIVIATVVFSILMIVLSTVAAPKPHKSAATVRIVKTKQTETVTQSFAKNTISQETNNAFDLQSKKVAADKSAQEYTDEDIILTTKNLLFVGKKCLASPQNGCHDAFRHSVGGANDGKSTLLTQSEETKTIVLPQNFNVRESEPVINTRMGDIVFLTVRATRSGQTGTVHTFSVLLALSHEKKQWLIRHISENPIEKT